MKSLISQFAESPLLITTSDWFIAPDGKQYKSVWGKVEIFSDADTLGIKTNAKSTNWYALVGAGGKRMVVAGCQILYVCSSPEKPNTETVFEYRTKDLESGKVERDCIIYIAQ